MSVGVSRPVVLTGFTVIVEFAGGTVELLGLTGPVVELDGVVVLSL